MSLLAAEGLLHMIPTKGNGIRYNQMRIGAVGANARVNECFHFGGNKEKMTYAGD